MAKVPGNRAGTFKDRLTPDNRRASIYLSVWNTKPKTPNPLARGVRQPMGNVSDRISAAALGFRGRGVLASIPPRSQMGRSPDVRRPTAGFPDGTWACPVNLGARG